MNMTEMKSLKPLDSGIVLLVGVKASNFDDVIKAHPRVVMWDSQNEHWTNKDMPTNTRAVFMTRFMSHSAHAKIVAEARKRNITIFNPEGTGLIARQVKELLGLTAPIQVTETEVATYDKLKVLTQYIDFNKSNIDNARALMIKAVEMGITTTEASLAQKVGNERKKTSGVTAVPRSIQSKVDVSVEILDGIIKSLQDMRSFLIETVDENTALRGKLANLKKVFGE